MKKCWFDRAWKDYLYWQNKNENIFKKINELIKDIDFNGNDGLGNPEKINSNNGYWTRQIDDKHYLVYKIEDDTINIAQCKGHYDDK